MIRYQGRTIKDTTNDDIDWVFGQIKKLKYSESGGEGGVHLNSMGTDYLQWGGRGRG